MDPIIVPDGSPACTSFDYSKFPSEPLGNADCLAHHKAQLERFGVPFGRNGFNMYDLHTQTQLYSIQTNSGKQYRGNIDGCVAPYGLMLSSASNLCRIGFEHKQSEIQKDLWESQSGVSLPHLKLL